MFFYARNQSEDVASMIFLPEEKMKYYQKLVFIVSIDKMLF